MRLILDTPQPIEKLRKIYKDSVTFITDTASFPLVFALEFQGDYLSVMKKRAVPVKVGKKVDKAIKTYEGKLSKAWDKHRTAFLSNFKPENVRKLAKADDPELADVLDERDQYRRVKLYRKYLLSHKDEILASNMDDLKEDLRNAATGAFLSVYLLGKNRGQILTHQELDDDLTKKDREILDDKEQENAEFLDGLTDDVLAQIDETLADEYDSPEEMQEALGRAYDKEKHRLSLFSAILGSALLASGMSQAAKDVQAVDPDTGELLDVPKIDPDTDLPIGEVLTGGTWRTSHDENVCDGCEEQDGQWMTWDDFEQEAGTNDCLTRCRCIELFEPSDEPMNEEEKSDLAGDLAKAFGLEKGEGDWSDGHGRAFAFDPNSTENEGRWRLYPPGEVKHYWRNTKAGKSSKNVSGVVPVTSGVSYVRGRAKEGFVVQAIRFNKEKFTEDQAREWWGANKEYFQFYGGEEVSKKVEETQLVRLNDLLPCPYNREIDQDKVQEIKDAIISSGKIKPFVVTEVKTDEGTKLMVTDGHHRYLALKEMKKNPKVPVVMADERGVDTAKDKKSVEITKGGAGSGNFGHSGRPGEVGGSGEGGGTTTLEAPTVTVEPKLTDPDFLSESRWSSDFVQSAKNEVEAAKKYLEVKPPISREDITEGFNSHFKLALDDKINKFKEVINVRKQTLDESKKQLEEKKAKLTTATGEERSILESELHFATENIAEADVYIKRDERTLSFLEGSEAHTAIQNIIDKDIEMLAKATSIGEQQALMAAIHRGTVGAVSKAYRKTDREQQELVDVLYSVVRNRNTQFQSYEAENLKGYMEAHNAFIIEAINQAGGDTYKNARRAVEGDATKTIEARPNFQEGRSWILNNFSPTLLAMVKNPVSWEAKRGGGSGGRSWYINKDQTIRLARDDRPGTIPHEFVHHLEREVPEIASFFEDYYTQRTGYDKLTKISKVLGGGYQSDEYTRLDAWASPYMGHVRVGTYGIERRRGGEIFSQSVSMLANPRDVARLYIKDPQLFGITMSILKGNVPYRTAHRAVSE